MQDALNVLHFRHEKTSLIKVNVNSERRERRHDRIVEYSQLTEKVENLTVEFGNLTMKFDILTEKVDYLAERVNTNLEQVEEKSDESQDNLKKMDHYRDCTSIKMENTSASHGKYDLFLPGVGNVDVQCMMDSDGKGWTVIMARDDNLRPHVDFDKSKKTMSNL